ncbi:YggT family protein [Pelagibaculum spongiae]|uniref:YggT family protein n=1 Tax=Pelagibaculum spongiae TaxID=2080658 RepID=A0A2V1GZL4_9GAMM|nr:YggT family protein [Pelagibaculum spongiae]PVZ72176.1 YggT family protein [Pelagibaculum spongiae]
MNSLTNAGLFLISSVFDLYMLIVLLRFLLQWARADFYNPISQAVVRLSNPPLRPLRRIIPGFKGLDMASLALVFALAAVKLILLISISPLAAPPVLTIAILTLGEFFSLLINTFFWSMIIQIILSWVFTFGSKNPSLAQIAQLTEQLTAPIVAPVRKILPPMGGLDLSPIPVILLLQFLEISLSGITLSLTDLARQF